MILCCSLLSKRSEPLGSPPRTYAGLKLSKNFPNLLSSHFLSRCLGRQKYNIFLFWQAFFEVFFQKKSNILKIKEIIFQWLSGYFLTAFLAAFYIIIGAIKSPSNPLSKKPMKKGRRFKAVFKRSEQR